MHAALLFEKKKNNLVRCTACNNYCTIKDGDSGTCGVRKNINGELFLLVYGQAAAANVDPMEKKPLFHFMPGQPIFSIGTLGCNFACEFCQNWDISQATRKLKGEKQNILHELGEYGYKLSPEEIIAFCKANKIKAVAFTYNEPVIFFEYALDTMKLAKKEGIKTVFVSNGFESKEALEILKDYLDAINIDLKSFNEDFYKKVCHGRLQPVLDDIKKCHELGIWTEVTTLFIPGENDTDEEMHKIVDFISGIDKNMPWHVSAFHPDYKMRDKDSTPHDTLIRAYEIGKKKLNHVYIGNVSDQKRSATYCPECNEVLIERLGYRTHVMEMEKNKCKKCKTVVAGVFE